MTARAFTLVETVATITITAVMLSICGPLVMAGVDGYAKAAARAELSASTSAAIARIARQVRDTPLRSAAASASPAIDSVTSSSITWSSGASVRLNAGSLLFRPATGAAEKQLLPDVSSVSIRAFDESNSALAATLSGSACDPIRRIELAVTTSRAGTSETLRTTVALRALAAGAAP